MTQNPPTREFVSASCDLIDSIAIQLMCGMMNSPLSPKTLEERYAMVRQAYDMAYAIYWYRKNIRASVFREHGFVEERSLFPET